jgi:dephospho-CoA kinase
MSPRIIGLTGGIATGKSTVSNYLADRYHLPVLDADLYSREAVAVGGEILAEIVDRYSPSILLDNGELNRAKLGDIIFTDYSERQWVESRIHPFVRKCHQRDLLASQAATVVSAIPLLFEAQLQSWVGEIWVVTCSPAQQLQRLRQRNPQLSLEAAQQRIGSQMPLADKVHQADRVLDNSGSIESLYAQIDAATQITILAGASCC